MNDINPDDRAKCMKMYTLEGRSIKEIHKLTEVSKTTLYRWKKVDKWDRHIRSGGKLGLAFELQKEFVNEIHNAIEQDKLSDPGTADKLSKLAKVIENIMPESMTLSNIFTLFDVLVEFVTNFTSDDFIKSFQQYLPQMSDYLRKKLSV